MTYRERLIELCTKAHNEWLQKEYDHETDKNLVEYCTDYLLANGVILSPIKKVGEKLYFHQFDNEFKKAVVDGEIIKIANGGREYVVKLKDGRNLTFLISFFGKTVFLTKEEAEQALRERD
jgi:hypothetical protein